MKELEEILRLWRKTEDAGEAAVLATVVRTQESSYRLPGARMLLTKTGQRAGSISGGCLEDDLKKKAWWLTEHGPVIRRYDTTPEGEIASGFGLGCNGIIHVLLERLEPGRPNVLDLIDTVRSERRAAAAAHVLQPARWAGQRLLIDTQGSVVPGLKNDSLAHPLEIAARACMSKLATEHMQVDELEVFIETLTPAVRLLIFGAGDDAVPLTGLAKFLGWNVSVFDGRAHYVRREKFPNADEVKLWTSSIPIQIDHWTVAVLMTHSYSQDLAALQALAELRPRYLGILGPRKRSVRLLADAGLEDVGLLPDLYGPMGLDIGADGPEQVALSVTAEIQATLNGRTGGSLRGRKGSIHAPDQPLDPTPFQVHSIVCA